VLPSVKRPPRTDDRVPCTMAIAQVETDREVKALAVAQQTPAESQAAMPESTKVMQGRIGGLTSTSKTTQEHVATPACSRKGTRKRLGGLALCYPSGARSVSCAKLVPSPRRQESSLHRLGDCLAVSTRGSSCRAAADGKRSMAFVYVIDCRIRSQRAQPRRRRGFPWAIAIGRGA
jgi:hypothetical protein